MKKSGKLFVISGPSGVGKTTLYTEVKNFANITRVVTTTTRAVREGEKDGVDYYFKSREEFENMLKNDEFLEHATYSNNFYGTTKQEVFNAIAEGKNVMLIIDVQGAMNVKKIYKNAILIFLTTTSLEVIRKRLLARGTDNLEEIERRLERAKEELKFTPKYDYVIVNDVLPQAVSELKKIIEAK